MKNAINYSDLVLYDIKGNKITCWDEWSRPKRDDQWVSGRSAMEMAKAWFRNDHLAPPDEMLKLLSSYSRLDGLELTKGIPEKVTPLPMRGEGRNHDLWLQGRISFENVTICIEAKADEPFGNDTVGEYLKKAEKRIENGESSGVPKRIETLLKIVGRDFMDWDGIKYQLLTAICGTILQAKKDQSKLAIFIVHVFHTNKTTTKNLHKNSEDFSNFLKVFGIDSSENSDNFIFGPIVIDDIDCLIGKVITKI